MKFTRAMVKIFRKMGADMEGLMARKAELLRKMPQFKDKTVTELNDAAHEEVIADAESRITELRKKTAELNREMDSLREKIKGVDKSKREEIKQVIYDH